MTTKKHCDIPIINYDVHQQYLVQLPKISQLIENIKILYSPKEFYQTLIESINNARKRIYLVALYLEQDQGGMKVLDALYTAKKYHNYLDIAIFVDWHRARRGRIGVKSVHTNADWYYHMAQTHYGIDIPIYGVPINIRETLGVLHLKGFVIDEFVIYTGASINNVYLQQLNTYRFDRYQIIHNSILSDTLVHYLKKYLLNSSAVKQLNNLSGHSKIKKKRNDIRSFRRILRNTNYCFNGSARYNELAITPLVGVGVQNQLNKTIHHLLCSTKHKVTLCTPYFNLPKLLLQDIINLLNLGKSIEIIVGDKIANDFYISEDQPFQIISIIPYFYEINLRNFLIRLQDYVDNGQLTVRLWENNNNSYHIKGIWVDNEWQLLTGNNLNPRAWQLDLENALLIHDPMQLLRLQSEQELMLIRSHTKQILHFSLLEDITNYPTKIRKLILNLQRIRIDRLLKRIL